jgi:methionyl-tRNA synthetase
LVFAKKYFNNKIPKGDVDNNIKGEIDLLYEIIGKLIEEGNFKAALERIFEFIRSINKHFDENAPWITIRENLESCSNTIYNCIFSIANLANLLYPFLPESSEKIKTWLEGDQVSDSRQLGDSHIRNQFWEVVEPKWGASIQEVSILFERLDKKIIEEEKNRLLGCRN